MRMFVLIREKGLSVPRQQTIVFKMLGKRKLYTGVPLALTWTVCCSPVVGKLFHDIKIFVSAMKLGDTITPPS
jgi:hypothetical protein